MTASFASKLSSRSMVKARFNPSRARIVLKKWSKSFPRRLTVCTVRSAGPMSAKARPQLGITSRRDVSETPNVAFLGLDKVQAAQ